MFVEGERDVKEGREEGGDVEGHELIVVQNTGALSLLHISSISGSSLHAQQWPSGTLCGL